jgi:hypothetical protein
MHSRPKTPLVDTRVRPRSPSGTWVEPDFGLNLNKGGDISKQMQSPQSPGSPDSMYNPYTFSFNDERVEQLSTHLINTTINQNNSMAEYGHRSRSPGQELDYPSNNINQYGQG